MSFLALGRRVTFHLHAEALGVLERPDDLVEERIRRLLELRRVPLEGDLLGQLELVALDEHPAVLRAAPVLDLAGHVGTVIGLVGHAVVVAIRIRTCRSRGHLGHDADFANHLALAGVLDASAELQAEPVETASSFMPSIRASPSTCAKLTPQAFKVCTTRAENPH